ncbi:hypothetical protein PYW07_017020 [Mythimna separata]|uniref:Uncharacterized protein n=1 Tax=Mythimna separata TaxID=271217 RepID=A0AAD7YXA3_MYTSE|nr:hypothetical protein PYW07_017020 [Mythimna separata]
MLIPTCLIKLCELMLTVACLTLHHYSYDLTDVPTLMLCSGTYVGYVVVLSGEIVVACLTLHHYSYDLTDVPTLILCSGTYVGYVVVLSGEIVVACLTLHHYSYDLTDVPTLMLCSGTYVGYVVVLSGEIVDVPTLMLCSGTYVGYVVVLSGEIEGEMLFAPLDLVQDMYYGMLGVALFSVSGGLVLAARVKTSYCPRTGDSNAAILGASLAIMNAIFMLFDLSLAYLDSEEFDEEASV